MSNKNKEKKAKRGTPIGVKLVLIISVLVLVSLGTVTALVSYFVGNDVQLTAEDNNHTMTMRTAKTTENELSSIRSNAFLMLDMLDAAGSSGVLSRQTSAFFFERNQDVAAVIIPGDKELINNRFFISNEIETSLIPTFLTQYEDEITRTENGETFIFNIAPIFKIPLLAFFLPWRESGLNQAVIILFSSDSLTETFGSGHTNLSYMINQDGDLLVHPDYELIEAGASMAKLPLVEQMRLNNDENRQIIFTDLDGKEYFGSYCKLQIADAGVITTIDKNVALKAVTDQTKTNIYLTICVLFIAVLFIWLFSKSISNPLKKLRDVAEEIKVGNFNTDLFDKLKSKRRRDEIGVLIQSTKDEREILNTISRLTNKGVAKAVVRKEIDFNPHLKDITIFFSDIRGFTAISDGFNKRFGEKSAGEIINFLNDYMSRMVNCITITGGNVDKFEGDAIMACWGVLRDDDLSFEKLSDDDPQKEELAKIHSQHIEDDAVSAIKATTAMRYALMVYNKEAEAFTKEHADDAVAQYKPHIRIGSGLNSGRATVGFMGSFDKMEFTSIGDAVNLASRTESSNKPCGTDMLITEDTYNLLKNKYIRCPENNFTIQDEYLKNEIIVEVIPVTFEVKGKGKQHFYGVVNMPNFDIEEFFKTTDPDFTVDEDCRKAIGPTGPKTLAEVRTLLGIPTPDFGGVNLDAEENKVTAS